MEPKAPCKDCQERELGCHDRCEKYQAFRVERQEYNLKIAEINGFDNYITKRKTRIRDNINKSKKR